MPTRFAPNHPTDDKSASDVDKDRQQRGRGAPSHRTVREKDWWKYILVEVARGSPAQL
jgi:hypothetical protein